MWISLDSRRTCCRRWRVSRHRRIGGAGGDSGDGGAVRAVFDDAEVDIRTQALLVQPVDAADRGDRQPARQGQRLAGELLCLMDGRIVADDEDRLQVGGVAEEQGHAALRGHGAEMRAGDGEVEIAGEQLVDVGEVVGRGKDDDLAAELALQMFGQRLVGADQRQRAVERHDAELERCLLGAGGGQPASEEQRHNHPQDAGRTNQGGHGDLPFADGTRVTLQFSSCSGWRATVLNINR